MSIEHVFIALAGFGIGMFLTAACLAFFQSRPYEHHRVCSWCHRVIDADSHAYETSHGICQQCFDKQKNDLACPRQDCPGPQRQEQPGSPGA